MSDIEAFAGLVDLVGEAVGGKALITSDDFFAGMENLISRKPAAFDPNAYTDRGKLMDGWESRRERIPGHDWCILKLGVPGRVRGVDIDTSFFLGNHPPFASLDGTVAAPDATPESLRDEATWTPILPEVPLRRGSHNLQPVDSAVTWTHVRLNIFPDGGVARLRVYGDPRPESTGGVVDLAALVNGGKALGCSDMFFSPMSNLILPGRSTYMGGGWETRRSRPPGMDWIILQLAAPGVVESITLDTGHFKGNYPDRAAIDGLFWPDAPAHLLVDHADWAEILPPRKLKADDEANFPLEAGPPITHVRLRILPDGGVARLRVWGRKTPERPGDHDPLLLALRGADGPRLLEKCCGARRWVDAMHGEIAFGSRTHLLGAAEQIWWRLGRADWLEAFEHHPRIGADPAALHEKFGATATWAAGEQAGVARADDATIQALADENARYEAKFGHIFIVCATGLTAEQMLGRIRERMDNPPDAELRIAAGEQAKITRLRLLKLAETP